MEWRPTKKRKERARLHESMLIYRKILPRIFAGCVIFISDLRISPCLLHEDLEPIRACGGNREVEAVATHTPDDG